MPFGQKLSDNSKATAVSSSVALTLVILKLTVGLGSGAMVLIASAVDSALDFLVSVFNHVAVRHSERPSDRQFNYGLGKIEGVASFVEGLVIALSSLFILSSAVLKIVRAETMTHPNAAIIVMVFSTVLTTILVIYLKRVAKRTGSLILKTDAVHYSMDMLTNIGILAALFLITKTGWYILDPLFSIAIAFYILHTSWGLIKEGLAMLLDHALPISLIERIEEVIQEASPQITSFHQLRTRKSANVHFVDVDLVFNKKISLMEAHLISELVEERIKALEEGTWVITCHLDPTDDSELDEHLAFTKPTHEA